MTDVLALLSPYVAYWPLLVLTFALSLVGKVSAGLFPSSSKGWRWVAHKTLSIQTAVLGGVAGTVLPDMPGIESMSASVFAGIGCGAVSVFTYQAVKGLLKKQGVDLDLPGLDGPNDDQ